MLKPGDVVDRYEIVAFLGRGGMGEVYAAHDTRLQRKVALKILRDDSPAAGAAAAHGALTTGAARMLREARASALLVHPNIVALFDVGEVAEPAELKGTTYLAMELIEGCSLRAYVGTASCPLEQRIRWLIDVANALGAAHARGLVHRDIKPENVMVSDEGQVKVLDFGIAKRSYGALDTTSSTEGQIIPTVTTQGIVIGTPHYMAPEQMRGEAIDGRADQFSWGVVAYELLSGRTPWKADADALQLVSQVLTMEAEPLEARNPEVPAAVAAAVMRALSKVREDRFESMQELVLALEGRSSQERTVTPVPRSGPAPSSVPSSRTAPSSVSTSTRRRANAPTLAPPDEEPRGHEAPPGKTAAPSARRWTIAFVAVAAIGGAAYAVRTSLNAPGGGSSGGTRAEGATSAGTTAAAGGECASNRDCVRAHGGAAFTCRKADRVCVGLASEDCHVLAETRDLESDDTVWIGSLYPLAGPDAAAYGMVESRAVELARQDFAGTMGTLVGQRALGSVHPLALVSCDDSKDATRAAHHLVDDVRVPAVIGFRSSAEAVDLAASLFIPSGVMTVAALNTSGQITSIPQPPGPRLVWRTTYNITQTAVPVSLFVSTVIEPRLHAANVAGPFRIALVRPKNAGALGFATALFDKLSFNGKSALENGANFRELVYDESDASLAEVATAIGAFAPHVVVFQGDDRLVKLAFEPLEEGWPAARAYRPTYVTMTVLTPEVFRFAGKDASRRRRFFGLTTVSTTPANARFVMHYNEVFPDKITRTISPNASYDAFYLLAYAAFALRDEPVTGASLAAAVGRLVPPGKPVDVGPTNIFDGFTTLRSGQNIDLNGATGSLDFDLATGDPPVNQAVLCVNVDEAKSAFDSVESGLVYVAQGGKLEGAMRCP